jgi:hypothetical protein
MIIFIAEVSDLLLTEVIMNVFIQMRSDLMTCTNQTSNNLPCVIMLINRLTLHIKVHNYVSIATAINFL